MEIGVLLPNFAQQLRCKNADVPDVYFTLLDAAGTSPTLPLNQNAIAKVREAGSLSKWKLRKLQRLSTQGGAAHGTVPTRVRTSNLSVSKVRQILQAKASCTMFTLATPKIKERRHLSDSKMKFGVWT